MPLKSLIPGIPGSSLRSIGSSWKIFPPEALARQYSLRPLSIFLNPSIYWIFRASQNANRWCIINQMFAKTQPLDARVKKCR